MTERGPLVVIRGAGDLASGVAHRLHRAGFAILMTEVPQPRALRLPVCFARAVYEGSATIEGVCGNLAADLAQAERILAQGHVPVLVDPEARQALSLRPIALVDAILAKRNLGTRLGDAPLVIALGPGYTAGADAHVVVETMRGHDLGRLITSGSAQANTGMPGPVLGYASERVLRSPAAGPLQSRRRIGERVQAGDAVATVAGEPVLATIGGVLRGLMHDGLAVSPREKIGDIDPRGVADYCFTISDKARALGGSVLEAILHAGIRPF